MQPIETLDTERARSLRGLLFDLDDTVLDGGLLTEPAYAALFRLRESGLELYAVTGRPAGWGAVLARQWPIAGAVSENGALAHYRSGSAVECLDPVEPEQRRRRRTRLESLVSELATRFPELQPADDVDARRSDFTFDIGERFHPPRELVVEAAAFARARGAKTITSSVHLHVGFDAADKASGAVRLIGRLSAVDPTLALYRYAFIGDSANDAACFAAFRTSIGVANLSGRPALLPRFVTRNARGAGFAEAAAVLCERRDQEVKGGMPFSQSQLVETGRTYLYPNYRQPPIVLVRGSGSQVWDAAGKRYLDLYAGIAVSTLGHAHPNLVRAVADQAAKLIHVSNYFFNEPNVRLAEKLCRLTGMARAFFCNSGTEAIEASLKLARRHFFARGQTDRLRIIAFYNSFHGRTLGALAATGQNKYRAGFGPLPGVTHVAYGDAAAVRATMGDDVAAILVEPVQGEGGVLPAPPGFLRELRAICDERGCLLVADEVQSGVGRTGKFLAFQHEAVEPDVVALAKALGGGVPIGAMLCKAALSEALPPGSHGSTFGGNPLASAAALAVLDTLEKEGLVETAAARGEQLKQLLGGLVEKHPTLVTGTRGRGLLQALVLRDGVDGRALIHSLQEAGVLLTVAGDQALRFSPPLVITSAELEEGVSIVDGVLSAMEG